MTNKCDSLAYVWAFMLSLNLSGGSMPGRPLAETNVMLLKRRCGLNVSVSRNDTANSDAPTTTILKLIAI